MRLGIATDHWNRARRLNKKREPHND